jgi:hypothetical protein
MPYQNNKKKKRQIKKTAKEKNIKRHNESKK